MADTLQPPSVGTSGAVRRVPASASSVLRPRLGGPVRTLVPRAIFDQAIHLGDPAGCDIEVAVVAPQAVVHPHAVVLTAPDASWPLAGLHLGSEVSIGDRQLRWGDTRIQVTRWWSPRPAVGPIDPARLRTTARAVREATTRRRPPLDGDEAGRLQRLTAALAAGRGDDAADAAVALLGLGAGSTPTGDDLLAGLLAGLDRFASGLPSPDPQALAAGRRVAEVVLDRCRSATTALSATLLRHAAQGQICRPAGRLIVGMARGSDRWGLVDAADGLLAVGSTSGRDLTLGLLAAAEILTHEDPRTAGDAHTHLDVRETAATVSTSPSTPGGP